MAIPKFEDFKAPWELKDGQPVPEDQQVVDKDQLKRWVYGVLGDKDKAQTARDTATTKVTELEGKLNAKSTEGQSEIQQLMALVTKQQEDLKTAQFESQKMTILTSKGFDPVTDKDLFAGKDTPESVEAYADLLAERGLVKKKDSSGEEKTPEEKQAALDGKPVGPLNNGLPNGGADDAPDVKAFLAQYNSQVVI